MIRYNYWILSIDMNYFIAIKLKMYVKIVKRNPNIVAK